MNYERPISINNTLCQGICNFNCRLCGVNKAEYLGRRLYQSEEVTRSVINRIIEASKNGINIRIVTNSGSGEPTLHPEFADRINSFVEMIRSWDGNSPTPELSIVTNGSMLLNKDKMSPLVNAPITVNVSFPTCNPAEYEKLMLGKVTKETETFYKIAAGIEELLKLYGEGKIEKVCFHISPPLRSVVLPELERTIEYITKICEKQKVERIEFVLFPHTANRAGAIKNDSLGGESYQDAFSKFHRRIVNGTHVELKMVWERFFANSKEVREVLQKAKYPCIWNANLFITADGKSICCNDQNATIENGDIAINTIEELLNCKQNYRPRGVCLMCDQRPVASGFDPASEVLQYLAEKSKLLLPINQDE